ncbi:alpha/beta fold hydrolase [Bacillus sp. 1NLA3E]|uniref:alpha/beta fold hydrolase n=1 Tax=Bacillus sp. 1NLA3E TaxID=666686 RepID=UPI000247EDE6|nr:alpha/beta hydrolase [Bacillus sp. 1NLA3E]AGK53693.1 alpha/beta hydrolase fold protein [Bacillus sp. 1NLA3E]
MCLGGNSIINFFEKGSGEPLLLIHGLGNNLQLWNSQNILANNHHLIIPELRGHGDSTISTGMNVTTYVSDILALLNRLKLEKVNVCGLSLGGIIAQELYLRKPSVVKSLILCNTISYTPFIFRNFILFFGFKNILEKSKGELIKFFASQCIYNNGDAELLRTAESTFSINKMAYIQSSLSSLARNYLPFLPFIKIPVLVLGSNKDRVTPVFSALQTYSFIPHSELHIFKECGHLSNIEKKDEFNHKVLSFLSKIS